MRTKKLFIFLFPLFLLISAQLARATFFGEVKTGLQNIAEDRYGYSVYVPKDYTAEKSWPLVLALHDESGRGEDYIQTWIESAQKQGYIVLCPTYEHPRSGLSYEHDQRLIELKKSLESQYEINSNQVLVTGFGSGGHYAVYLGLRYPQEFSGIASIGNGFQGSFEKILTYAYAEIHQLPILMLLDPSEKVDQVPGLVEKLNEIQSRGYRVETVETENAKDLKNKNTNSYVLEWFHQVSTERELGLKQRKFSAKQSFYEWVDNLVQNR